MQLEIGNIVEGKVTGITNFGAFIELPDGKVGMVHISEVAGTFVKEIRDHLTEQQIVKVKILNIDAAGKINLSIKKAVEPQNLPKKPFVQRQGGVSNYSQPKEAMSFEDMLNKFKQTSDERMSDLKKFNEGRRSSSSRKASHK